MPRVYAYLDTNVFLHFQSISRIPWCDLLAAPEVELVLPAQVLRELNDKKDHGASKLRSRARAAISELKQLCPPGCGTGEVADGVTLRVRTTEPQIDWEEQHLDQTEGDDRILAEMIEEGREPTLIVGHDVTLEYKAKGKGFDYHEVPDQYRLPEEPTQEERRIRQLEEYKRKRESLEPCLQLGFELDDDLTDHIRFTPHECEPVDVDRRVDECIQRLQVARPDSIEQQIAAVHNRLAILKHALEGHPPSSEYDRYEGEVEEYAGEYRKYLEGLNEYRELRSLSVTLRLGISNSGSAPAEDVVVELHFGDGFLVVSDEDFPPKPQEPTPPTKPRTATEVMRQRSQLSDPFVHLPSRPALDDAPNSQDASGPIIEPVDSFRVRWPSVGKIKHHSDVSLDPLHVIFGSEDQMCNFNFRYELVADNSPERFEGQLHVLIG